MTQAYEDYIRNAKSFYDKVAKLYSEVFPITYLDHKLDAENLHVDLPDLKSIRVFEDAKFNGRNLTAPIVADMKLYNGSKLVGSKSNVSLGDIPILTPRKTYILNGKEYKLPIQMRLGHGGFVHEKSNGEIQGQVNVKSGIESRVMFDTKTNLFSINAGGRKIGLLPILIAMGVDPQKISGKWGNEIYKANEHKYSKKMESEVSKANSVYTGKNSSDVSLLSDALKSMQMDKEINYRSIGKEFGDVSGDFLLSLSGKILNVNSGKEEVEDRDSLQFKYVLGDIDYYEERIKHGIKNMQNKYISRMKRYGDDISQVLEHKFLSAPIMSMLKNYSQVVYSDQSNPLSILGDKDKMTIMGEGGIKSTRQLTPYALRVNPTSFGIIDPVFTPDGDKIGAVTRKSYNVKVKDKKFWVQAYDTSDGTSKRISHIELIGSKYAPESEYIKDSDGKYTPVETKVTGYYKGKEQQLKPSEVRYIIPAKQYFNIVTWYLPFLNSLQGNRAAYATKMISQAVPLKYREERLVAPSIPGSSTSVDTQVMLQSPDLLVKSPVDGVIKKVTKDEIVISDKKGKDHKIEMYNNFPLNEESFINHEALVRPGMKVQKGKHLLADSNYTKKGKLALGTNMKIGYTTLRGNTLDDGLVISESGARKLTSLHMYKFSADFDDNDVRSKHAYASSYPGKSKTSQLNKLDDNGVVKKGMSISHGDIIFVKMKKKDVSDSTNINKIQRSIISPYIDMTERWKEDTSGVVTRVINGPVHVEVYVNTEEIAKVGDKISNLAANKGTISDIIPDDEMPKGEDDKPLDLIINPHVVPSRINPSQLLELAASKIAEKEGKQQVHKQFDKDNATKIYKKMKELGISPKENVTLPDGRVVKINTGKQHIIKLQHMARKKNSARYRGAYNQNLTPAKSEDTPSGESMDLLTLYSLQGHNARNIMKETITKGEKNDDFWNAVELGLPIPKPKTPFTFNKFMDYIRGAGVSVKPNNGMVQLLPATDKAVEKMSKGEITSPQSVYAKTLKPIAGGLYDPSKTGGVDGDMWSHIDVGVKIPNPIVIKNLAPLLGFTIDVTENIARGKAWVDITTNTIFSRKPKNNNNVYTGWDAFKRLVGKIDIDSRLKDVEGKVKKESNATILNGLLRQAKLLRMLKNSNMKLEDLFISKVTVLPPKMRPIYISDNQKLISSGINRLYKEMIMASSKYKELKSMGIPEERGIMRTLRSNIYDIIKKYQGIAAPETEKDAVGLLRLVKGKKSSKDGFFFKKMIGKKQDLSGHGVIGPDISLDLNKVGMPIEMAWTLYAPFVIKSLIQKGYTPLQARAMLKDRSDEAKLAMFEEAKNRPVLVNRNPSLHKFNITAMYPEIRNETQIKINPAIHKFFNSDFDGDTMSIYVPVSAKAVEEARSITPDKIMIHPGKKSVMFDIFEEGLQGLYLATNSSGKNTGLKFGSIREADVAYKANKFQANDKVIIGGKTATYGSFKVNDVLPEIYRNYSVQVKKKYIMDIINRISKKDGALAAKIVKDLQILGSKFSDDMGFTVGIEDLIVNKKGRNALVNRADKEISKVKDIHDFIVKMIGDSNNLFQGAPKDNAFVSMVDAGSKGTPSQIKQILYTPMFVNDHNNVPIPRAIKGSYGEGLKLTDYLATQYGVRVGAIGKKKEVSDPGYINKLMINATGTEIITMDDCGTKNGRSYSTEDKDIVNRYLSIDQHGLKRNTLVTTDLLETVKSKKIKSLMVRTPMTCMAPKGVCKKCMGLDEYGKEYATGQNIGVLMSQSLVEPLSQGSMRKFHTGGVSSKDSDVMDIVSAVKNIIMVPAPALNNAALSPVYGKITGVRKLDSGANLIKIRTNAGDIIEHKASPRQQLIVKPGDKVNIGDELTTGTFNVKSYSDLVGRAATQDMIVKKLSDYYSDSGMDKKVFEVVTRVLTNYAKVNDSGDNEYHLKNDVVPFSLTEYVNNNLNKNKEIPAEYAMGYRLGTNYGNNKKGDLISPEVVGSLKKDNINMIKAIGKPMKINPIVAGVKMIPRHTDDWLEKMTSENQVGNLIQSIVSGLSANVDSPFKQISAYVTGAQ